MARIGAGSRRDGNDVNMVCIHGILKKFKLKKKFKILNKLKVSKTGLLPCLYSW